MTKGIDIKGQKFGLLTVLEEVPQETRKNKRLRSWLVKCDCGSEPFEIQQRNLTRSSVPNPKLTQSCGCIRLKATFLATTKFPIDMEFLNSFEDLDKFFFIHKQLVKMVRHSELEEDYKDYIEHFYNDPQLENIYRKWYNSNKEFNTFYDFLKPSLDHKLPTSRGGDNSLENLHFLTVFENLAKRDMTWEEWEVFKKETDFGKALMLELKGDK